METTEPVGAGLRVLNRDVIKYIAMIAMLLNHIADIFGIGNCFIRGV